MPHLLNNPLKSNTMVKGEKTPGNAKKIKRTSTEEQPTDNCRPPAYTGGEGEFAAMISPEQEKDRGTYRPERTRDDRELAALQTMLELPNTPPSPASHSKEGHDGASNDSQPRPSKSKEVCYEPQPRSFVPYSSSRGRGMVMPHHYARSPRVALSPQYSPHMLRGGAYSPPHSPFMPSHLPGPRVSQRGGAHGGRFGSERYAARRPPAFDMHPYYYEAPDYPGYYAHPSYHYAPDAFEHSRPAEADEQEDEPEKEHAQALSPSASDSAMDARKSKDTSPKKKRVSKEGTSDETALRKERRHYHPQPHYLPMGAYPSMFPYARYPSHPLVVHAPQRPRVQQLPPSPQGHPPAHALVYIPSPHSKHSISEGSAATADQYDARPRPEASTRPAPSPAQMSAGSASREKCVPLKGPIPSKFWGDVNKFKDAYVPVFDQLVNFPDYLPKHQTSRTISTASVSGGSSALYRHCVMCGKRCLCTASSSPAEAAAAAAALKDETSSDDGSFPSSNKDGDASGGVIIPRQNKGLCTRCDVTIWVVVESGLQIKWCKGCKNYRPWAAFGDKGGATKCMKCRDRQKEKYAAQKILQEAE